ncbi:unnamed protein product [Vitrella brassicaformis CCMP3155]|uniref:Heat shock protein 70 n=2 Tax=Vitrella brassicaformis TaxID=1169539 RepID=A0A0G4FGE3_VITBC|nr:unnamed protein product [Vitrella brassicaformis CCMP3155]|mmetsp:Transcript_5254/g.12385  ORF Transcript_5254/g.12385 Transcript_5254/m.12385 type:complete len:885 (+) Transcript_5254:77-2731(+)|eukprot:CEM11904.1 unnamed protein product [Vitrella brassicaformis CCMP3155]
MSVVGIDIGTSACCIAALKSGAVHIVRNEISERLTPSVVGYTDQERLVGDVAVAQIKSNFKNTCRNIKLVLGRCNDDPDIAREKQFELAEIVPTDDGLVGFKVNYKGEERVFTASRVLAALLNRLREIAERDAGTAVRDVVIGIPGWYTDMQRRAVMDAAEIAGLHVLRVFNEHTATALDYGIYRSNTFSESEPSNVAFVCMGHGITYVTVAEYVKGQVKILSEASDRQLGGRDLDHIIVEHFAAEFKKKTGMDIMGSKKARLKMEDAATKTKKILSANQEAPFNVECVMEEEDIHGLLKRGDLEKLCEPLIPRLQQVMERALAASNLSLSQIAYVEIAGGGTRVPWVQECIKRFFQKEELSKTLNADETVARGCALMGAMISPAYKVRPFSVHDVTFHPISIRWQQSGKETEAPMDDEAAGQQTQQQNGVTGTGTKSSELFPCKSTMGSTKSLTFMRSSPFEIEVFYSEEKSLPPGVPVDLGKYHIKLPESGGEKQKVKIRAKLDNDGIFTVESAQQYVEEEYEETVKQKKPQPTPPPPPQEVPRQAAEGGDGATATSTTHEAMKDADTGDAAMKQDGDVPNGTAAQGSSEGGPAAMDTEDSKKEPAEEWVEVKQKKKRTRRTDLQVITADRKGIVPARKVKDYHEEELNMRNDDRIVAETREKMNELESYVYRMREKITDSLKEFVEPAKAASLQEYLTKTEDWLYDNWDAAKSVIVGKLDEMTGLFSPIEKRFEEHSGRTEQVQICYANLQDFRTAAMSPDDRYAHIDPAKKQSIVNECDAIEKWLNDMLAKQEACPLFQEPLLKVADITAKQQALNEMATKILSEPKPAPPPPPKPDNPENDAEMGGTGEGAADDSAATGEAAAPAQDNDANMEGGGAQA